MIVDKKEIDFINKHRPHGFIRDLTNKVNKSLEVHYSTQMIGWHLRCTTRRGGIKFMPDEIIEGARKLLKEQTGLTYKK